MSFVILPRVNVRGFGPGSQVGIMVMFWCKTWIIDRIRDDISA